MKKSKLALAAAVALCVLLVFLRIYRHTTGTKVIGTASGPEWEYITIGDLTYEKVPASDYSIADQDRFLGIVISGDVTFRIYAVKGDQEGRWLYRLWDWEGAFYRLMEGKLQSPH